MLQHAAAAVHSIKREAEAAAIIPWAVVFATPSSVVHIRHLSPQLAGRMSDDGIVARVGARVSRLVVAFQPERFIDWVFHHEQNHRV
jgi:hypothetical protein